MATGVANRH